MGMDIVIEVISITILIFGQGLAKCPEPDPVVNAYRYKDDNFLDEGSWLNYTCYMNCILYHGDLTRQCLSGFFTGTPPVCLYSCGPPPNINDMIKKMPDFTIHGSMVNYTCLHNDSIKLTAVCDSVEHQWIYNDAVICPQPGNVYKSLNLNEPGTGVFYDNNTGTCKQSDMSATPFLTFSFKQNVDVQSFEITFGESSHVEFINVKMVNDVEEVTLQVFDIISNETKLVSCQQGTYVSEVIVEAILRQSEPNVLTICEFSAVGNVKNESCYGQPTATDGAEVFFRSDEKIKLRCLPGFYRQNGRPLVKCTSRKWTKSSLSCKPNTELISIHGTEAREDPVFDLDESSCMAFAGDTDQVVGTSNRPFIISSISTLLSEHMRNEGLTIKVFRSRKLTAECYFHKVGKRQFLCDVEDFTEGDTVLLYKNFTDPVNNELCALYVTGFYKDTNIYECFQLHPSNYQGKMNYSFNGMVCDRWDQVPSSLNLNTEFLPDNTTTAAENFCRDPDNSQEFPWCFVKNYTEKLPCLIQSCAFCSLFSGESIWKGSQSKTSNGNFCTEWDAITDRSKVYEMPTNLNFASCRNFGNGYSKTWCFTNTNGTEFDACNSIPCAEAIDVIHLGNPSTFEFTAYHSYCYWLKGNPNTEGFPYHLQYNVEVDKNYLQYRCLHNSTDLFCYTSTNTVLTYYQVRNCDGETSTMITTEKSATSVVNNTPFFSDVTLQPDIPIDFENLTGTVTDLATQISNMSDTMNNTMNLIDIIANYSNINNLTKRFSKSVVKTLLTNSTKVMKSLINTTVHQITKHLCLCTCSISNENIRERIENITFALTVEKRELSSFKRTKVSIYDERPSVLYVGSGAVLIFCAFLFLIILPDIIDGARYLRHLIIRSKF